MKQFDTGATRNSSDDKIDFDGHLSPLVLKKYGEYMHRHRKQEDGSMRDSDNWKLGIPLASLLKSKMRHDMDLWILHHYPDAKTTENLEDSLCAIMFNTMAYLHEILKYKK